MLHVQLLGIGCRKSRALKSNLLEALKPLRLDVRIKEVSDIDAMLRYGITGAPALVLNGRVISQNAVPDIDEITALFTPYLSNTMSAYTIRNILVPVDFSDTSRDALRYAKSLALETQAVVRVAHVYHPEHDPANPFPADTLKEIATQKRTQLNEYVAAVAEEEPHLPEGALQADVLVGFTSEELVRLSELPDYDLIVMGTTGASGFLGKMFGSISSDLADQSHCPVLFIPGGAVFSHLQDVAYASTGHLSEKNGIRRTLDLIRPLGVQLHLVHVQNSKHDVFDAEQITKLINSYAPAQEAKLVALQHDDVAEALQTYAAEQEIGMLVASTRQRSFFEKLFHSSVSKELLRQSKLPFLLFHSDEA